MTAELDLGAATGDARGEGDGGERGCDAVDIFGRDVAAQELRGDGAVVRTGVGVEQVETFAERARGGGLARGGAAVDGDDEEG